MGEQEQLKQDTSMNDTPPDWLQSLFIETSWLLQVLFPLRFFIIIFFIIAGIILLRKATTKSLGKQTLLVGFALCGVIVAQRLSLLLTQHHFSTFAIVFLFVDLIAFYGITLWWGTRLFSQRKSQIKSQS
jgi:hypothetical protein